MKCARRAVPSVTLTCSPSNIPCARHTSLLLLPQAHAERMKAAEDGAPGPPPPRPADGPGHPDGAHAGDGATAGGPPGSAGRGRALPPGPPGAPGEGPPPSGPFGRRGTRSRSPPRGGRYGSRSPPPRGGRYDSRSPPPRGGRYGSRSPSPGPRGRGYGGRFGSRSPVRYGRFGSRSRSPPPRGGRYDSRSRSRSPGYRGGPPDRRAGGRGGRPGEAEQPTAEPPQSPEVRVGGCTYRYAGCVEAA